MISLYSCGWLLAGLCDVFILGFTSFGLCNARATQVASQQPKTLKLDLNSSNIVARKAATLYAFVTFLVNLIFRKTPTTDNTGTQCVRVRLFAALYFAYLFPYKAPTLCVDNCCVANCVNPALVCGVKKI